MALNTFLECTGSVVGWYGLLAPEIIEVLEASPSKPSVSSLFLMLSSFISTSRPDIRAGSGLKWTAVPWSSETARQKTMSQQRTTLVTNDHRKLQPCVWPTTLHPPLRPLQPHSCRRAVLGSCWEQCWTISNDHGCSHGSVHISQFLDAECNVAASLRPQTTFLRG